MKHSRSANCDVYQAHTYSELRHRFTTTCGPNIPNGSSRWRISHV